MGKIKYFIWKLRRLINNKIYNHSNFQCPICGMKFEKFSDVNGGYGHIYYNSGCPYCGSLPRHRSLFLLLREKLPKDNLLKLLHFAPESFLIDFLKSYKNIMYLSADINKKAAMRKEDISNLSFKNEFFDVILCLHVLEHVKEDKTALIELYRVLKKNGFAIIDVPIDYTKEKTYENPSIISPEERTKHFWQSDHLRLYGRDFPKKLKSAGFKVQIYDSYKIFGKEKSEYLGLNPNPLYICKK